MDATYRYELREINELNYQRFEAKLEQRIAELRAEVRTGIEKVRVELRTGLSALRAELLRWMVLFWLGTVGPLLLAYLVRG